MADPAEISATIQSYTQNISVRADRVSSFELRKFKPHEVRLLMAQLLSESKKPGNNNPCGPDFNIWRPYPLWATVLLYYCIWIGVTLFIPLQLGAAIYLFSRGRIQVIRNQPLVPTRAFISLAYELDAFVKPSQALLEMSLEGGGRALCFNRAGQLQLMESGYAVVSHVWGETMGWAAPNSWGPVHLSVRRKGIPLQHLRKFFDRYPHANWLWLDVLSMPEVLEGISPADKTRLEETRIRILNTLHKVYTNADEVIVIDTLLLRLHNTESMIDVAVILCLSRWITRLWTFTESWLAKRVILKTADSIFDLDSVIDFLRRNVIEGEDKDRYFGLLYRLCKLRPRSAQYIRIKVAPGAANTAAETVPTSSTIFPTSSSSSQPHILESIYFGCENRLTDVDADQARALFPLLHLTWQSPDWTLRDGLERIQMSFPEQKSVLEAYCTYRNLEQLLPLSSPSPVGESG